MKRRIGALLAALVLVATVVGCGYYHGTSRGRTLSGNLALPFLENRTAQPDLELRATEALTEAFETDGSLRLVSRGQEQYLLSGSVVRYSEAPFSIGQGGSADEYKLTIVLELSFLDSVSSEAIWTDRRFTGTESFFVEGSAAGAELTRDRAEEKALEQIVDGVLNAVFGDW